VLGRPGNDPHGYDLGWGLNVTGDWKLFGADRFVFGVVYGHGIASYMNDGGVDMAAQTPAGGGPNEGLAVPLLGFSFWYEHAWSKVFSTTVGYSQTRVENRGLQEASAFHRGQYAAVNFLAKPLDDVLTGIEVLWGERQDRDGNSGADLRAQFTLKYSFSKKPTF